MFFIGVFSSHIPYILLAIVYLACMPAMFFNKAKCDESMSSFEAKVIQAEESNPLLAESEQTVCFANYYSTVYQQALKLQDSLCFYCSNSSEFVRQHYQSSYQSYSYQYNLFSRPPPVAVCA